METTEQDIQSTETEIVDLDDLDFFWMDNGLPVFMANRQNICDIIEELGFSIYYLLTNNIKTTTTAPVKTVDPKNTTVVTSTTPATTVTSKSMQLYKVVNNFVGRTVSLSNDPFNEEFIRVQEEALYTMPAIPYDMVQKLDQFFRLVDAQHGTESIVMLTYDITKEGSDGWGILVPDQVNTSVHCNYDPDSIASVKPDNVMIVGSVHSHPDMSAYASGTDHKDQADFDGIHITYGWQSSVNNGATQYHIEMQMAGKAYTLKPEDVFEGYSINKTPDPEVVEWTEKVKKVSPPNQWGVQSQAGVGLATDRKVTTEIGSKTSNPITFAAIREKFNIDIAKGIEEDAIIAVEIPFVSTTERYPCPVCAAPLDDFDASNGYCDICYVPLVTKNKPLGNIVISLSYYCSDLKIEDTNVPVYLYVDNNDNTFSLMKIIDNLKTEIDEEYRISDLHYGLDDIVYDHEKTVCCGSPINICKCEVTVTLQDMNDFDVDSKKLNFYEANSKCQSCEFFYNEYCQRYFDILRTYTKNHYTDLDSYASSINDIGCTDYVPFSFNNED